MKSAATLEEILDQHTAVASLWKPLEGQKVECYACAHRCRILPGHRGICKVRFNRSGTLYAPSGYVSGFQVDPIEKKPFFHVYPGSKAASFGMLGCDFHCAYCQNWYTSQTLRDPSAGAELSTVTPVTVAEIAVREGARVLTSTYNEPLITAEWAMEVFREGAKLRLPGSFVSNGNATREALEFIRPWVRFFKVDLKCFSDSSYRKLGGVLDNVLTTIHNLADLGFWVEIVTLVVPGFNDSEDELSRMAGFIASVSPDIPWHVTAFHTDYQMQDKGSTPVSTLIRACEIGREAGLRFVYAGNRPGQTGRWENTNCPECDRTLIARYGFRILENNLQSGACPHCRCGIPGVWD